MKVLAIIFLLALGACGKESSPEGRSKIRDEKLQLEITILKEQNKAILDSISEINKTLRLLKQK